MCVQRCTATRTRLLELEVDLDAAAAGLVAESVSVDMIILETARDLWWAVREQVRVSGR